MTGLNMDRKTKQIEDELKQEMKDNKRLSNEVERLKNELAKNALMTASGMSTVT